MFKDSGAKTPEEYIKSLGEQEQRDIQKIHDFIQKTIPNRKPSMASGMIGYDSLPYKSKSGSAGMWPLVLLSSRKNYISIYVCAVNDKGMIPEQYQNRLKADIGKSCVRFKKIEDIDWDALGDLLKEADEITKKNGNSFFVGGGK